jgi:hypothetical protein
MRLIGCVDGVEISFDFHPPSTFTAEIPRQIDGTYIVQLQAIDDAGNVTNYSNIFVLINFNALKFQILESPFGFIYNGPGLAYRSIEPDLDAIVVECTIKTREMTGFIYREVAV